MWTTRNATIGVISLFCLSVLHVQFVSLGFAASASPSDAEVSLCEDRTSATAKSEQQGDESCTTYWAEELQQQEQAIGDAETRWKSFHWGPYPMDEFELSLLYPPGERRPLWGY
jgi:hypothetical protein